MISKNQLIYRNLAKYYDCLYNSKNYKEEVKVIRKIIKDSNIQKGVNLLDIGCATGNHLRYLSTDFCCYGIDINSQLLDVAKTKGIKAHLINANMIDFKIDVKFEIITCLFGTIAYLTKYKDLANAIINISQHMSINGLLIIDPWFSRAYFHEGGVHSSHFENENLHIDRMSYSTLKGNVSVTLENYMIGEKNLGVRYFVDRHKLLLFDKEIFTKILSKAGFLITYKTPGLLKNRELIICRKL